MGRTGHSRDRRPATGDRRPATGDRRQLHGAGPCLDAIESRDERVLLPGSARSVEPGVWIPDAFGLRSEVNLYLGERDVVITPREYQRELMVV